MTSTEDSSNDEQRGPDPDAAAAGEITSALRALEAGEPDADNHLLALVYERLRRIAEAYVRREGPGVSVSPSDLVHEAYLRLFRGEPPPMKDRAHLYSAFARAARRVLVDQARARAAAKRGGQVQRVTLTGPADFPARSGVSVIDLLALDEALERLRDRGERYARIVELRCFAGLTVAEVAETLGIGTSTADRDWAYAKAWLHAELGL